MRKWMNCFFNFGNSFWFDLYGALHGGSDPAITSILWSTFLFGSDSWNNSLMRTSLYLANASQICFGWGLSFLASRSIPWSCSIQTTTIISLLFIFVHWNQTQFVFFHHGNLHQLQTHFFAITADHKVHWLALHIYRELKKMSTKLKSTSSIPQSVKFSTNFNILHFKVLWQFRLPI